MVFAFAPHHRVKTQCDDHSPNDTEISATEKEHGSESWYQHNEYLELK